jgi:hypothetical protein
VLVEGRFGVMWPPSVLIHSFAENKNRKIGIELV